MMTDDDWQRNLLILADVIDERNTLREQVRRLTPALEACQSWIDRWAKHVGNCEGGIKCTCGMTLVLFEARAALSMNETYGDKP